MSKPKPTYAWGIKDKKTGEINKWAFPRKWIAYKRCFFGREKLVELKLVEVRRVKR